MDKARKVTRMGRPVRAEGGKPTKERIFEAAIDLFSRKGYDRTSVRQIAKAVGLTESAVYRHYPNKEAILEAIFSFAEKSIYTPLPIEEDLGGRTGMSLFRGLLAPLPAIIGAEATVAKIARIMYAEMLHDPKIRRYFQETYVEKADDHLEALFRRGMERGVIRACDPRALARVFNAFRSEWTFQTYILDHGKPVDLVQAEKDLEQSIRFFEQFLVPDRDGR